MFLRQLLPLFLFLCSFSPFIAEAQDIWPRADSEWHSSIGFPPVQGYKRYYVDGQQMIQGKNCTRILMQQTEQWDPLTVVSSGGSFLYFDGDTLWWPKQGSFYPLLCFNAVPGDSWHPLPQDSPGIDTNCVFGPIKVIDTSTVYFEGEAFRSISISTDTFVSGINVGHIRWGGTFNERTFGGSDLFPSYNWCPDGVVEWYIYTFLCYHDSTLSVSNQNVDCEYPWDIILSNEEPIPISELKVYPNPVGDRFVVEWPTSAGNYDMVVVDVSGREVERVTFRGQKMEIDSSKWPSGIYGLRGISQEGESVFLRLVKL